MRGFNFVPIRSDAYFPEWKLALSVYQLRSNGEFLLENSNLPVQDVPPVTARLSLYLHPRYLQIDRN
jgi:hypothetical protein